MMLTPPTDLKRQQVYKYFVKEHGEMLSLLYEDYIQPINPQISLNDWILFAYNQTSQDGLRFYP